MAKKTLQEEKMRQFKEVNFEIAKDAFEGPFFCHRKKTKLMAKKAAIGGFSFSYTVWQCPICKTDYLDSSQSKKMEFIWTIENLLNDKAQKIKRSLNFDGKMFFLRFPKELTRNWSKKNHAEIKVIDNKRLIVEISA